MAAQFVLPGGAVRDVAVFLAEATPGHSGGERLSDLLNGQLVMPKRYIATQFSGQLNYLKVGLYRNDTVAPTGVVYHDGWVMARSLSDVMP